MAKIILWDSDGTLVDSFPGHAQYLKDMNKRDCLNLELPDSLDVRDWEGKIANPMSNFFRAAGFPEEVIEKYVGEYESLFFENYSEMLKPFPQTNDVLRLLRRNNVRSIVITSNTEKNVKKSLENELEEGLIDWVVGLETARKYGGEKSKTELIRDVVGEIGKDRDFVYIGDMEKDFWAAYGARVPFIGVSYGWEIRENTRVIKDGFVYPLIVARSLKDVASVVLKAELSFCHPKKIE